MRAVVLHEIGKPENVCVEEVAMPNHSAMWLNRPMSPLVTFGRSARPLVVVRFARAE